MRDFHDYLEEIDEDRALCAKHAETAAIHDMEGQNLELYRMFKATANAAEHLRTGAKHLPDWEESLFAKHNIEGWEKLRQQVTQRMEKHGKQHEVLTKGVAWEGRPVLIHAYKFEPDPRMKVELIVPPYGDPSPMLPIQTLAVLLRCHEFLLAPGIVAALPPYVGHDVKFMTLWEYLEAKMPKDEYAIFSLPTYQNVAPSA